jgi:hypothetical protein
MAVRKATRSISAAQPRPERPDHQLKAEVFETLRHLNRGYGVALAAFDRLESKDRLPGRRVFPGDVLNDYRYRTETLRAEANRDLLRLISGHEDNDALRLGRLRAQREKRR